MAKLQRKRHSSVSTGGATGFPGQYLLADGAKADIRTPDYNKKTLPTVVQIVPAITAFDSRERPVKPHFEPFRTMDGTKYEYSHWYLLADIVRAGIGDDRVTFILCDPHSGEDPRNTPYGLLYRRITRAVKEAAGKNHRVIAGNKRVNPNNWAGLLPGNNNTSLANLAFSRPERSRVGFVPALMIVDNGKLVLHPETGRPLGGTAGNHAQILQLSGNAMETLLKQAALPTDAFDENSEDWDAIYQHGDVTRLDGGGKFCVVYNATHHTTAPDILCRTRPGTVTADAEDDYDPAEDTAGHGRRGGSFASYSVDFTDRVRLPKISGNGNARYSNAKLIGKPDIADAVLSNYSEIWDYFQIPELEKHCRYLAEAFRSQPEIILFGWADNPEYFTDEVKGILAARTQVAAPGASQDEYDDEDEDGVVDGDLYDDDEDGVAGDQGDLYDDEPAPSKPLNRAAKAMARGAAAIEEDVNTYYDDEDDDEVEEVDEEIYEDDYDQEEGDADAAAVGVYEDAADEEYDDEEEEEEEPVAAPPRRRRRDPVPLEKPAAKRTTAKKAPAKKAPSIADLAQRAAAKRAAASGTKPRVKRRPKDGLPPA